jgi:hypothetical protein
MLQTYKEIERSEEGEAVQSTSKFQGSHETPGILDLPNIVYNSLEGHYKTHGTGSYTTNTRQAMANTRAQLHGFVQNLPTYRRTT